MSDEIRMGRITLCPGCYEPMDLCGCSPRVELGEVRATRRRPPVVPPEEKTQ